MPKLFAPATSEVDPNTQPFDGIICIGGEDWWYHNRGHFDFQIMRRLAKNWPVLFVNSIGVRFPTLTNKAVFAQRIGRKIKSLARGMTNVENDFWVYSPLSVPGRTGQAFSNWTLASQINIAAKRIGIKKPLVWVHCPPGANIVDHLNPVATVLQRTDRFEAFPEGDHHLISAQIQKLKSRADVVIYAAPHLMDEETNTVRNQLLVTHGVDVEKFENAGNRSSPIPDDIKACDSAWKKANPQNSTPKRIGFIGGLDAHTFDADMFLEIARTLPQFQFVLVGGSSLPEDWCTLENVALLGRKPYDDIAGYMAAMDVLIMPWNNSDWIKACNPIKLKEYIAVGRPIVTRDFAALGPWREFVKTAETAPEFADAIRAAALAPFDPIPGQTALKGESWDEKAQVIARTLTQIAKANINTAPNRKLSSAA